MGDNKNMNEVCVEMDSTLFEAKTLMKKEDDDFVSNNNHDYVKFIPKAPNDCKLNTQNKKLVNLHLKW